MTCSASAIPQTTGQANLTPDVCVIIINYGTAELAILAAQSVLARDHGPLNIQIHIVDNASPGDDAEQLSAYCSTLASPEKVILHLETINHGFGRGNNLVLRQLAQRPYPPRHVFFLNPDAKLKTDVIPQLTTFLDQRPNVAVVGCGIDDPHSGKPVTAAFRFPGFLSELATGASLGPISRLTERWAVPLSPGTTARRVDWVAGAAMMVRFSSLQNTGLFDEEFFLYFEETELMNRLAQRGWETWEEPDARIDHIAGASTGVHQRKERPARLPEYWYESWRLYFVKKKGPFGAIVCATARLAGVRIHELVSFLRGRSTSYPAEFPKDFTAYVILPLLQKKNSR